MNLREFFEQNKKAALGFSGGVDSVYLLYAAKKYGADIMPYYIKTPFQPQFEYEDAVFASECIGVDIKVIEYDILSDAIVSKNHQNRCYYCKKALFSLLKQNAEKDGYNLIIDGTNASDDVSDRPGMKALLELSVRSPLCECGLTKHKIRELSKEAGLFTWNKPAYACLATRLPVGMMITKDLLKRIEIAESILSDMGFVDFRVRVYDNAAQIQIKDEQFEEAAKRRKEIAKNLDEYFEYIFFDTKTR